MQALLQLCNSVIEHKSSQRQNMSKRTQLCFNKTLFTNRQWAGWPLDHTLLTPFLELPR